jgi:hypothetical protein
MRRNLYLFALLQLFCAWCLAQPTEEPLAPRMQALIQDVGNGFAATVGEKVGERGARSFFKSKVSLGGSELIVFDSDTGKKRFMQVIKQSGDVMATIEYTKGLIDKVQAMQELAKTLNLKFERKPMEGGGMRNTLHNEAGVLLVDFRHTTVQQTLEIATP